MNNLNNNKNKALLNTEMLYSELSTSVNSLIEGSQRVFLAIYDTLDDEEDFKVKCPEVLSPDPVIKGDCKFCVPPRNLDEVPIFSLVLNSPSWKDILNTVNEMLKVKGLPSGFLYDLVPRPEGIYECIIM